MYQSKHNNIVVIQYKARMGRIWKKGEIINCSTGGFKKTFLGDTVQDIKNYKGYGRQERHT